MKSRAVATVTRRLPGARALVFSGLVGLAGALVGCGDAADPTADFVGTWRYVDYSSVLLCPQADPMSQPPEPNKTLARGPTGGLVDLSPSPLLNNSYCDFAFTLNGPVATAAPDQLCHLTSLDTLTIDQPSGTPPRWTFTLNSPTTAEELITATAHFSLSDTTSACAWSFTGHLQRVSKD
jgi:hypothetical protein